MKIDTENIKKILKFWETSDQGKKKSIDGHKIDEIYRIIFGKERANVDPGTKIRMVREYINRCFTKTYGDRMAYYFIHYDEMINQAGEPPVTPTPTTPGKELIVDEKQNGNKITTYSKIRRL